jgi:phosphoglycerate dehydrogenase-like enzyme
MAARRVDEYREALRRPSNRVYARLHLEGAGGETLRGRTVGILGFGRIGKETARLLQPFGPRLLVHDPYVGAPPPVRGQGDRSVTLARLLRESESSSSPPGSPTRRAASSIAPRCASCVTAPPS